MSSTVEVGVAVCVGAAVTVGAAVAAVDVGLTVGWVPTLDVPECGDVPPCVATGSAVVVVPVVGGGAVCDVCCASVVLGGAAVVVTGGGACVATPLSCPSRDWGVALRVLCTDMKTTTPTTRRTPAAAPPIHTRAQKDEDEREAHGGQELAALLAQLA